MPDTEDSTPQVADQDAAQPDPGPPPSDELVQARHAFQLEVWQRQQDVYDAEGLPPTLRGQLIYAEQLAKAGMLPEEYRQKPANVLIAIQLGQQLGMTPVQALLAINVVKGRPSLGAVPTRAVILAAKHDIWTDDTATRYSDHGVPLAVTVRGRRNDNDREVSATWELARAARAGLCQVLWRDGDDHTNANVFEVRARSQKGEALPWEAHTESMLEHRATTLLARRAFPDCTLGLSYERDELDPPPLLAEHAPPIRAAATRGDRPDESQRAAMDRDPAPEEYDPTADLELFDGKDWRPYAGAQVRRRNKLQLAADRLARHYGPDAFADTTGPAATDTGPAPTPPDDGWDVTGVTVTGGQVVADEGQQPPGWVDPTSDRDAPAILDDGPALGVALAAGAEMDEGPLVFDGSTTAGDPPADVEARTVDSLLADIDRAAEQLGKSRAQLMVRWVTAHRKNPEDATADELADFLERLEPLLANDHRTNADRQP